MAEGGRFPRARRVVEDRFEAVAFEVGGEREAGELGERGIDIDELDEARGLGAGVFHAGDGEQQRAVGVVLGIAVFAPGVVLAEFPTVIAPENHDGVLAQVEAVEFVEHATELGVHVGDGGVVAVLELAG